MSAQTYNPSSASAPLAPIVCQSLTSKGTGNVVGNLVITSPLKSGTDTAPVQWTFWDGAYNGGGLQPDHLQIYQYTSGPDVGNPTAQLVDAYLATTTTAAGPPPVTTRAIPVWRPIASRPQNDSAPWVGTITIPAAGALPLVTPCAQIPDASRVRVMLVGASAAAFTAGIVAPTITIQPNVSFSVTAGTEGAIYAYEVLAA